MNQFFEGFTDKAQDLIAPVSKVNKVLLENVNELVDIQSKALGAYTELGLNQAKAAMEVRDTESLTAFVNKQSDVAEEFQNQFKSDIEKLSGLANKASAEISEAFSKETE